MGTWEHALPAVGELRQPEGMNTGTAVKQLTHQEEQRTLRSLSYPQRGPGNPPGPEQGSRTQTFQPPLVWPHQYFLDTPSLLLINGSVLNAT